MKKQSRWRLYSTLWQEHASVIIWGGGWSSQPWNPEMTAVSSDNLLNFYEWHTHRGLKVSLLPNRTVLQEDGIRASEFLAAGSCHLGGHLKLSEATEASPAVTVEPRLVGTHRMTLAFSLGMGEWIKAINTSKGTWMTGNVWHLEGTGEGTEWLRDKPPRPHSTVSRQLFCEFGKQVSARWKPGR